MLEENDESSSSRRVRVVRSVDAVNVYSVNRVKRDEKEDDDNAAVQEGKQNLAEMRFNWTKNFLDKGGFEYIMNSFLSKEITQE